MEIGLYRAGRDCCTVAVNRRQFLVDSGLVASAAVAGPTLRLLAAAALQQGR